MTDLLSFWAHPTTLVFLIGSAALLVTWRMSNARISLKWDARTHAAEPSATELAEIELAHEAAAQAQWERTKAERAAEKKS